MGNFSCLLLVLLVGISIAVGAANESQEPCAYDASGMPDGKGSCSRQSNTDTSVSFETEALLQTTLLRQHKEMKLEDVYDYPSCRPACLVNNGGCPGGEGCHQVSGRIYRFQGTCYRAVGGCWGCLESPTNYPEALSPVQCPEEPITSTIQCCTAARPTVNNQVGICGCDATAFPSGREFYLADKLFGENWSPGIED